MAEPFLIAKNLHKSFNDHKAVNDVSFTIEKGEIFGLLGPNGAGKTTTINILCGLIKPTSGTAKIYGYDVQKETQKPGAFRNGQSYFLRQNGGIKR